MTRMTCDEAFEALTDPLAAAHPELEQHLAACARCRQMRDVLAPALSLFAGQAPAEFAATVEGPAAASGLPARAANPSVSTQALRAADQAARQLSNRQRRRPGSSWAGLVRTAAVFVLGALAALGVAAIATDGSGGASSAPSTSAACLWTSAERSRSEAPAAEQVILSCVACHLPASGR